MDGTSFQVVMHKIYFFVHLQKVHIASLPRWGEILSYLCVPNETVYLPDMTLN